MKVVIQRVNKASVTINNTIYSQIDNGLLVLAGFEEADTNEDLDWMARKIVQIRIFNDSSDVMNLSVTDVNGQILVVSQFTLHASTKKGNRPSYIQAAKPDIAIPLYEKFVAIIQELTGKTVKTGQFGADMQVALENNGPVTIVMDTKNKI